MNFSVFANMRKERMRYAIAREVDRQAVEITEDAVTCLVDAAAAHIDASFEDDDKRGTAAERAERTINPVITALASTATPIDDATCQDFLQRPTVAAFPWTVGSPD